MKIPVMVTPQSPPVAVIKTAEVPMSALRPGDKAQIVRIDNAELELALLKMGVAIGDSFTFASAAPFRGPVAIRAMHTKLSLRREDAQHIWINRR